MEFYAIGIHRTTKDSFPISFKVDDQLYNTFNYTNTEPIPTVMNDSWHVKTGMAAGMDAPEEHTFKLDLVNHWLVSE